MSISETRDTCYHQLSLFVVQKHTKSDNWLCLFILLVKCQIGAQKYIYCNR